MLRNFLVVLFIFTVQTQLVMAWKVSHPLHLLDSGRTWSIDSAKVWQTVTDTVSGFPMTDTINHVYGEIFVPVKTTKKVLRKKRRRGGPDLSAFEKKKPSAVVSRIDAKPVAFLFAALQIGDVESRSLAREKLINVWRRVYSHLKEKNQGDPTKSNLHLYYLKRDKFDIPEEYKMMLLYAYLFQFEKFEGVEKSQKIWVQRELFESCAKETHYELFNAKDGYVKLICTYLKKFVINGT